MLRADLRHVREAPEWLRLCRLSRGSGFKRWEGCYSPVGASWWEVIFCIDKLQGE